MKLECEEVKKEFNPVKLSITFEELIELKCFWAMVSSISNQDIYDRLIEYREYREKVTIEEIARVDICMPLYRFCQQNLTD